MSSSIESFASVDRRERAVIEWMEKFQDAVRAKDFNAGRHLFHEDVVSFGTVAGRVDGLDELVEKQWACRWPRNQDFRFESDSTVIIPGDRNTQIALVSWSTRDDERRDLRRHGRATLVLRTDGKDFLCVHSHFSLVP